MSATLPTLLFMLSFTTVSSLHQLKEAEMVVSILKRNIPKSVSLLDTPSTQILYGWADMELKTVAMYGFSEASVLDASIKDTSDSGTTLHMTLQFTDLTVNAGFYHLAFLQGVNSLPPTPVDNQIAMTLFLNDSSCSIKVESVVVEELGDIRFNLNEMCLWCRWVSVSKEEADSMNEFVRDSVHHELTRAVLKALNGGEINRNTYQRCAPKQDNLQAVHQTVPATVFQEFPQLVPQEGRRKYVIDSQELFLDLIPARKDGACLFNTLSMALYGTEDRAQTVREDVVDYVLDHYEHYGGFITDPSTGGNMTPEEYSRYMRRPQVFGTVVEVTAASELYKRRVIVFRGGSVYCDVGRHEWPSIMSSFSGSLESGHFDLLVPIV